MALRKCVDCGRILSSTATTCLQCGSTDPFGRRRSMQQRQLVLMLVAVVVLALVAAAFKFGLITPAMLRDFLLPSRQV